ncbi:hypothetical protein U8V72_20840 [Priestia filamentosa]|uniref:hypothetical protein n=1 Tax=Priestia filamentosa TaxID=1402861 RepID=UPI00397CDF2D
MLKIMYQELNEELGVMQNFGKDDIGNVSLDEAFKKADSTLEILKRIKDTEVSYVIQRDNSIIVEMPEALKRRWV